jgi:uncharacterized protein YkwD
MRPPDSPGRLRRTAAALSVIAAILGMCATSAQPASAMASLSHRLQVPETLSSTSIAGYRANITSLTNAHRRNAGVPALTTSPALTNACQAHANDMVRMGRLTHIGSDGSNGGIRARRYGFPWSAWGENIAAGYTSSAQVVNAWMNSSGHRSNMLNRGFTRVGVGVQSNSRGYIYYCMLLARP